MTTSAQANQRLTEATNAAALARVEVNDAREAVAVGEATAKDVTRATRALEKAVDRAEQARVDLLVIERREAAEAEATAREAARIRRELDAITTAKATAEAARYREFLEATRATADGYNVRIGGYEERLGRGAINVPSRFTSFGLLGQALADQLTHFPAGRTNQQ